MLSKYILEMENYLKEYVCSSYRGSYTLEDNKKPYLNSALRFGFSFSEIMNDKRDQIGAHFDRLLKVIHIQTHALEILHLLHASIGFLF